nr:MAG TPA: hypothetical protein [Inoviridae sp.]
MIFFKNGTRNIFIFSNCIELNFRQNPRVLPSIFRKRKIITLDRNKNPVLVKLRAGFLFPTLKFLLLVKE